MRHFISIGKLMRRLFLAILFLMVYSPSQAEVHIHAGELFDAASGKVLKERTVVVDGERVQDILKGYINGAVNINLRDAFVMPGLIDMHVHIASEQSPHRNVERFVWEPADYAYRSIPYAERTLMAGFTTVRDLGTAYGLAQSMRDAIAAGVINGPRIFTAGKSLATTGGHADPTNGMRESLRGSPGPNEGVINGVEQAAAGVRARYKERADLIKITSTGGVLSQAKSGQNPQFSEAEIRAIVETAQDYGYKVAAHAHGTEGMRRAVIEGVDSIEHGTFMTAEIMSLMKKNGTWYVPTIVAGMFVAEKAKIDGYFSELVRPKAVAIGPQILSTFAKAYKAGVRIAFGTDTGVSPHGQNWQEFIHMVGAGMPPVEALQSATVSAAELLGQSDHLGELTPGKYADIIAFPTSPLEDITVMGQVQFVMKAGQIYKR